MDKGLTAGEQMQVDTAPEDLAHGQEVGQHRFTSFIKGEQYAYARGLEVSPTHLPRALDAMLADGWKLVSLFGQTDAKHVGFVFEWVGPNKRVNELLAANSKLVLTNRALRSFISEAVAKFKFYATSHRAKGTPDGDAKADTNDDLAMRGQDVLDDN